MAVPSGLRSGSPARSANANGFARSTSDTASWAPPPPGSDTPVDSRKSSCGLSVANAPARAATRLASVRFRRRAVGATFAALARRTVRPRHHAVDALLERGVHQVGGVEAGGKDPGVEEIIVRLHTELGANLLAGCGFVPAAPRPEGLAVQPTWSSV